jgi:aryl-alcohol dehydrogenase-like predicted oxidoreductase
MNASRLRFAHEADVNIKAMGSGPVDAAMLTRMRYLARPDLPVSVLGFGCGAVLGRVGRRDSLRALAASWDHGVTFFDTARSYGYGEAEGVLGDFLRGKRDRAIVSTKFGILAEPQSAWKRVAKPLVRGLLDLAPGARSLIRRSTASQLHPGHFSPAVLRQSLEESLSRLRTDYVDLLFLHSPPASVLEQGDLFGELDRVVGEGKVRFAGLSADPPVIAAVLGRGLSKLRALQFPANLFDAGVLGRPVPEDRPLMLANHPFGGVIRVEESRRRIEELAGDATLPTELREKLSGEGRLLLADVVFSVILQGTAIDAVIPAMMQPANIAINVRALSQSRFTLDEAATLRERFFSPATASHEALSPGDRPASR